MGNIIWIWAVLILAVTKEGYGLPSIHVDCNSNFGDKEIVLRITDADGMYIEVASCIGPQLITGASVDVIVDVIACSISWGSPFQVKIQAHPGTLMTDSDVDRAITCAFDTRPIVVQTGFYISLFEITIFKKASYNHDSVNKGLM